MPRPKKPIPPPRELNTKHNITPAPQSVHPPKAAPVQRQNDAKMDDAESTRVMTRPNDISDTRPIPPVNTPIRRTPAAKPQTAQNPASIHPTPAKPVNKPARPAAAKKKATKKRKKKSPLLKVFISLLTAAALLFGLYSFVALRCIKNLQKVETEERSTAVAGCLSESYVRNILLIGSDSRDGTRGRSDTMMLVSLNSKTNRITLVSFLRDSYLTIAGGHGKNRLNAAYSFGGPELLMDTIQNNYKIRIDDYVEVNFLSFAAIIDAVGGVEVTITDAEAEAISNILRDEVNSLAGDPVTDDWLSKGGTYRLNGKQALSYSRIRKVGNADFERTERQRAVITGMITSLKESGFDGVQALASEALPNLITNMSTASLYGLSLRAPFLLGYEMEQLQIPADGTWKGETIGGASVLTVNLEENQKLLEEKLYATE